LIHNSIVVERKKEFLGASAKPINVEFVLPKSNSEPIFLYPLHSLSFAYARTLAYRTLVYWDELKDASIPFKSACILDDNVEEEVWRDAYPFLRRKADIIGFWSEDQTRLIEVLT
jgi:hypothetical protein